MTDPRTFVIDERLKDVKRIIAVSGWKGGIGKSAVSAVLALILNKKGLKTGLLDLDLTGASADIILGAKNVFPAEIEGLEPPVFEGVKFMSPAFFCDNKAVAFRGEQISDAVLEMLCVSQWRELDFLIMDLPPGLSNANLDVLRWIKRAEFLAVTIPSILSVKQAEKNIELLEKLKTPFLGVIENMSRGQKPLSEFGGRLLGSLRYDDKFEHALGDANKLLKTNFAVDLETAVKGALYV